MRRFALITIVCFASFGIAARAHRAATSTTKPVPIKLVEIGKASRATITKWMEAHQNVLGCSGPELYIINYASDREVARREKAITDGLTLRCFDRNRITLVRGGKGKSPLTVVWEIPPGADYPEP